MFFDGVLTPGRRAAAAAAPEQRARTSDATRRRLVNLPALSTVPGMAAHEILVWSDYI
jgi:hypothetical protein